MADLRTVPELAFVFPGQGSQAVGMLDELAAAHPSVGATLQEASDALGYDLFALIATDSDDSLGNTEVTQPAILATSVAIWRVWQELTDVRPAVLAGHSLGEYSALVCAGSLSFAAALTLVRTRGQLMQQAVPQGAGAMAAVLGLSDEDIESCCASIDGVVAPANYNAPGQVVIAGEAAAVALAIDACKAAGAKRAVPVAMSVPSHSTMLAGAAAELSAHLADVPFEPPAIPVVHNVDAAATTDPAEIRTKLTAQLHNPVLWTRCVQQLQAQGITGTAECGPGKVLGGLQRRIDKSMTSAALASPEGLAEFANSFAHGAE